jgi:putative membrane protein
MWHQMDGGYMWFGWIFWLILISVIVWLAVMLTNRTRDRNLGFTIHETPLDILKKRYAKGEITKEQFEEMKKTLGT